MVNVYVQVTVTAQDPDSSQLLRDFRKVFVVARRILQWPAPIAIKMNKAKPTNTMTPTTIPQAQSKFSCSVRCASALINRSSSACIASALGVANVLEGTVRRNGNHVRVSIELVEARDDNATWADSFDRDLTDIFAIQSEVAQTVATKLAATLSPEEKRNLESKPTENLEAYDLYLQAKELLVSARVTAGFGSVKKPLVDAIGFLDQAVRLDPKFTLAYCESAQGNDLLYLWYDPTPERRALGDAAINSALGLQSDLPEVHLAYAFHLYCGYHDYERARTQLAIARRGLPNDSEAIGLEALMDRRQGQFEKAIQEFKEDPRNTLWIQHLADTLYYTRQFRAAEQAFDQADGHEAACENE